MKFTSKTGFRVIAAAAVVALAGTTMSVAPAQAAASKTFNVWWYEKDTPMASTWAAALAELQAKHKDVKVNFELKTWDQIQKGGNAILDSNKAPDLAEWNKGNATAGTASQAGLLTDLTPYAKKYGWDKLLPSSVSLYGQYSNGIMGTGKLYGVPSYGEYVSIFYNKDLFAKYGVSVPKTAADLTKAMDTFKAAGVVPMQLGGAGYQIVHLAYALAASKANQAWVSSIQLFKGAKVDPSKDANFTYAANTIAAWTKAGYFEPNVSGVSPDDAVAAFQKGNGAMLMGGSWLDQGMYDNVKTFKYGKFLVPGTLSVGSAGNLLLIPARSKNKDLAAEFINMILSKKYQNFLGNAGGLALFADTSAVANPATLQTYPEFARAVKNNALAMYPDWPVAGYYDVLLAAGTKLLSDGDTAAYLKTTGDFYNQNRP
jgi:raffinose/stachyose/melibiose transport system substrate-binding protein